MDRPVSFGYWLQRRRKSFDLTQPELARRVGCSVDTIKKIETDVRRPSRQLAELLADQLEINGNERTAFIKAARAELAVDRLPAPGPTALVPDVAQPGEPLVNPYKGLRAFQADDAADFFGRTALVQQMLACLAETSVVARFLAVVGPSGSGKSSVVRAGLLPALRSGALAGAERWSVLEILPGAHPFEELEAALLRLANNPAPTLLAQLQADPRGLARAVKQLLPADAELLLVIDQFEELFTLVTAEAVRVHFLESLYAAVTDPHSRLRLIITLRADFYDRPLLYNHFGVLVCQRTTAVPPLTADELHQAIAKPAARVGVAVEPELIAVLTREVGEQPGALPLLQYALTDLFEHRQGQRLTLTAYRAGGGIIGALSQRAEALYAGLAASAQAATRQIFLRLLTLGEGVEDTRRRVPMAEVAAIVPNEETLDAVLDAYGYARLFTFDRDALAHESTVEVAHEALIRTWPRLRLWIDESRSAVRMQRLLAMAAADWRANDHEASYLLRGARLAGLAAWAEQTQLALTADEGAFLAASVQESAQQEAAERMRQQRELTQAQALAAEQQQRADEQSRAAVLLRRRALLLAGALVLTLLVAAVAGSLARRNATLATKNAASAATAQAAGRQAELNFANAESQRLAAEASGVLQRGESAERAALLALRGLQTQYTAQADAALQRAARTYYGERLFQHPARVDIVAFSPDGRTFLTGAGDGIARLWDVQSGQEIRQFQGHRDRFNALAFSPDGRQALTGSIDKTARLWDVQSGRELRRFAYTTGDGLVAFTADGRAVWTGGPDGVQLWQINTGAQVRRFAITGGYALDVSPDGAYLLTGYNDGRVQVLDAHSGQPVQTLQELGGEPWGLFGDGGRSILTTSLDKMAVLWDTASGKKLQTFAGHTEYIFRAALSADGTQLLTGSLDMTARLWDVATGTERYRFAAHTGPVATVAFSPDGQLLLTGSSDGTVRLWDLGKRREPDTFAAQSGLLFGLAFSPDGKQLLTGSADMTAVLWDVTSGRQLQLFQLDHRADTVAFSPDGTRALITPGYGGTPQVFDLHSGAELFHLDEDNTIRGATFSPDGNYMVTGSAATVSVWDVQSRQRVQHFTVSEEVPLALALSPDGKSIATASIAPQGVHVRLWDVASGQPVREFADPAPVNSVAFSPDGKYLLSGGRDNMARLWDIASGQLVRTFVGHTFWIWSVSFSPDGKYVLTASQDRTARLWDVSTGEQLRLFPSHANTAIANAIFAPDGHSVVVGSFDGVAQQTPTDLNDLIRAVCGRLLRDLTDEERTIYGISAHHSTC